MIMKIAEEQADKMVLKKSRIVGFLFGGIFVSMVIFGEGSLINAIIVMVVGLALIAYAHKITIIIDKKLNKLTIINKTILKKREEVYDLGQVASLELKIDVGARTYGTSSYFILEDGKRLFIYHYDVSGERGMGKMLKRLSAFIDKPYCKIFNDPANLRNSR